MKPSQKGRACQASYQPAHLTEPPSESIILITRLTSALINSRCKHKRLTPRQKKNIYIYLFELCKNVYNREDTVLSKPVNVLSPTSFSHIING